MKPVFTLIILLFAGIARAQFPSVETSFESGDSVYSGHLFIDTINCPNNNWQVGQPQKTVFNSAHSGTIALVTDTANPYSANDTSVFILKIPARKADGIGGPIIPLSDVSFVYQLDIDSSDICLLEISRDSGQNWVNYLNDVYSYSWWGGLDSFNHSTNGWVNYHFGCGIGNLSQQDSVYFRFTFIADSNLSNKDGWIIDDIFFEYLYQSVNSLNNNNLITIYPNPSSGSIKIQSTTNIEKASVQMFNLSGQKVYETNTIPSSGNLDLSLPDGMYMLKYSDEKETAVKRLVIQH